MRLYSADEEERIRAQAVVREWTRSGLLDEAQGAQLAADVRVDRRRTNPFLRAGLALFTVLLVGASVGLVGVAFGVYREGAAAILTGGAALACIGLATVLVTQYRCYRFGVEETLAVVSVVLLAVSGVMLNSAWHAGFRTGVIALVIGAAGGLGVYLRFGYVYAAIGTIGCLAALPFQLDLPDTTHRALAAAVLAAVFVIVRAKRVALRDDYPGDEYGSIQAVAGAAVYFVLNLQVTAVLNLQMTRGWAGPRGLFYWSTYAATWALPLLGLRTGIRDRDRELIDVSLVLGLVTLTTSKPYLGWARNTWDPIVLGVALIAGVVALRRWLSSGPGGERDGFTAERLLDKDRTALSMLSVASVLTPHGVTSGAVPPRAEPRPAEFGGGRSGGGGGGGSF